MHDSKVSVATRAYASSRKFRPYLKWKEVILLLTAWVGALQTSKAETPAPVPPSLLGWWRAEGSANDSAGENNGVATSVGYAAGMVQQAFRFIGDNSFIRVPSTESLRTLTNITFECWIWNDPAKPFRRILTLTPDHVILGLDEAGKPFLNVAGQDFPNVRIVASEALPTSSWHHLAASHDGTNVWLYVDGQSVASGNARGNLNGRGATQEVYINFFDAGEVAGFIDEAAVYSRALTPTVINWHFNAGSAGLTRSPVFSPITVSFPGKANLAIHGPVGKPIVFEYSMNLTDWVRFSTNANPTGTIFLTDPTAGLSARKFYRALAE